MVVFSCYILSLSLQRAKTFKSWDLVIVHNYWLLIRAFNFPSHVEWHVFSCFNILFFIIGLGLFTSQRQFLERQPRLSIYLSGFVQFVRTCTENLVDWFYWYFLNCYPLTINVASLQLYQFQSKQMGIYIPLHLMCFNIWPNKSNTNRASL